MPFAFVCLAMIPIMFYGTNSELAKWKAARAQLLYEDGDIEGGIEMMEQAIEQSPRDQTLKLELSRMLMPAGRADEALELIDGVVDQSADPRLALDIKSNCLLYLNRPQEALATLKEIPEFSVPGAINDSGRLNQLAYFRALAQEELDDAKRDIDQAVTQHLSYTWWLDKLSMTLADQTLVATAMVANRLGRSDIVLEALDKRIDRMEETQRSSRNQVSEDIYQQIQIGLPIAEQLEQDLQKQHLVLHSQKQYLAVMYAVRALIHQRNGDREQCDTDRLAAESWDHDPDELLSDFPSDWDLMTLMSSGAQYLDTRAMVTWARDRDFRGAVADLDRSVLALEVLALARDTDLPNTLHDEHGRFFDEARLNRSEATIRRHRASILLKRGKQQQADADFARIRELGFDDDDVLF